MLARQTGWAKAGASVPPRMLRYLARHSADLALTFDLWWVRREVARGAGSQALRIFSHTNPRELAGLYKLARAAGQGAVGLEIGAHLGASSCYLAAGLAPSGGRLLCVDTWHNETMNDGLRDTFPEFQANTARLAAVITPLRKRSDLLDDGDVPGPIDLAFIDGDHSHEAVQGDFERVTRWLRPGGTVVFHDFSAFAPGVQRVVGGALASDEWRFGGLVDSLIWLTRRAST
jgi:predicted O-methyltransferase YrrM